MLKFLKTVYDHKVKNLLVLCNTQDDLKEIMKFMTGDEVKESFQAKELFIQLPDRVLKDINRNMLHVVLLGV